MSADIDSSSLRRFAPSVGVLRSSVMLNFVREHTPESCTRLCALLCCLTGCTCSIGTIAFAFRNPDAATTVAALVGVTSALIAAGCVALLSRTRKSVAVTGGGQ